MYRSGTRRPDKAGTYPGSGFETHRKCTDRKICVRHTTEVVRCGVPSHITHEVRRKLFLVHKTAILNVHKQVSVYAPCGRTQV